MDIIFMTKLESYVSVEKSSPGNLVILSIVVAALGVIVGWGIRENKVIEEIKKDPVGWVSRLPLDRQVAIKEYLKRLPEGLQTVQPAE